MIARLNTIGFDLENKLKSLVKGFNSVGFCYLLESNNVWYRYFHFFFSLYFFSFLPTENRHGSSKKECLL